MPNKFKSFEYLLLKLEEWYVTSTEKVANDNDLSVLKSLKLLFLTTAADIELNHQSSGEGLLIDTTFTNFFAMPLGHVESDIYSHIKETKGILEYFNIGKNGLEKNSSPFTDYFDIDTNRIDSALNHLKEFHPMLITMEPFELVDLTHKWDSWRFFYVGRKNASYPIPTQVIKQEVKYFR